ncbi:MAG: TetR/AcrR family transcriptional regulator [Actinomycetota bacterium]|nr:TetR/AcrR family transcriptional regulator [Actinomycetota bacterium]
MTEYTGRGDQRRSMELLWSVERAPVRGQRTGLSAEEIVAEAIAVADTEGLDGLSMRKVAERLGRSPMSLYTYVPGKAELLDVMVDRVMAELVGTDPLDGGWRAAVERSARATWAMYERHPWVLRVGRSRAAFGPNELDVYEERLRQLDGLGLSGAEMVRIVVVVDGFVRGSAQEVADARTAERVTGLSDDDWWNARMPLLEELSTRPEWVERFPVAHRLAAEEAFARPGRVVGDPTPHTVREALDAFDSGLRWLLDGIEAFIRSRNPS